MRTTTATDNLPAPPTRDPVPRLRLTDLAAALEDIELKTHPRRTDNAPGAIPTGWPAIDLALGAPRGTSTPGLACGHIHDFVGLCTSDDAPLSRPDLWLPPLSILIHLARRIIAHSSSRALIVWIGSRCRPYPCALSTPNDATREILQRSIFVDASSPPERAWAIDISLRSQGVSAVIADASGLNLNCSRRFQLAAGAGNAPLGLLVHPPWQIRDLSAARTRWRITPAPPTPPPSQLRHSLSSPDPRWTVELLRRKGPRPNSEGAHIWTVRHDHETGNLHLAPDAPDRRIQTPPLPAVRLSA